MNYTEHSMPQSGRTVDRMTQSPGWAGTHHRAPGRWSGWWLAALIGAVLAAVIFYGSNIA